jgi:hypothetical protein
MDGFKAADQFSSRRHSHTARKDGLPPTATFEKRYDEMETNRILLIQRLSGLNDPLRSHPEYRRVLKLVNHTFRKSPLAQCMEVPRAASWLIDVLERQ